MQQYPANSLIICLLESLLQNQNSCFFIEWEGMVADSQENRMHLLKA